MDDISCLILPLKLSRHNFIDEISPFKFKYLDIGIVENLFSHSLAVLSLNNMCNKLTHESQNIIKHPEITGDDIKG